MERIFSKAFLAVEHNKNLSIDSHSIQKLLPNFPKVAANQKLNNNSSNVTLYEDNQRRLQQGNSPLFQLHRKSLQNCITTSIKKQTQTDSFASESLKRFQNILSRSHSSAFCQIMDIFWANLAVKRKKILKKKLYSTKQSFSRVS